MMRRAALLALSLLLVPLGAAHTAAAHVVLRDSSDTLSSVLHINPDDDPIAGQEALMVFDLQASTVKANDSFVSVEIAGPQSNESFEVSAEESGNIPVRYTFQRQGAYTITLTIRTSSQIYTFQHTQYVTRGVSGESAEEQNHPWAEAGFVASISVFAILMVVGLRYRREIHRKSVM